MVAARIGAVPIANKMVVDNHSVNFVSSILTAILMRMKAGIG